MHQTSDRELFLRCCQGEEKAWEYLYGYVLSITRWARWGLGDAAEDIAQAVLLSLMERGLSMVRSSDSFRSFVRRTTINRVLDHFKAGDVRLRHRGRPAESDDPPKADPVVDCPDGGPGVEDRVLGRRDLERMRGLLEVLPGYCEGIIRAYMKYRLGLLESYQDIARHLGRPLNTVSVQIKRCLEHFRRAAARAGILEPH